MEILVFVVSDADSALGRLSIVEVVLANVVHSMLSLLLVAVFLLELLHLFLHHVELNVHPLHLAVIVFPEVHDF